MHGAAGGTAPSGPVNFCVAAVDEAAGKVHLDLGNALPSDIAGGAPADIGTLSLVCLAPQELSLGEVSYRDDGWYERTAGVVTFPADRALTAEELQSIASNRLAVSLAGASGTATPAVTEPQGGLYVRADGFVFRLDPGATADVRLFATRYGRAYAGATIRAQFDPGQLQGATPPRPGDRQLPRDGRRRRRRRRHAADRGP